MREGLKIYCDKISSYSNQIIMKEDSENINYFSSRHRFFYCEKQDRILSGLEWFKFSNRLLRTLEYSPEEFITNIKKHGLFEYSLPLSFLTFCLLFF